MWIAKTIDQARQLRHALTGSVSLVPTMGALHAGHARLIQHARELCDHVVVSIFVNPTQFGPGEDYTAYPRPLDADLAVCRDARVHGVFQPTADEIYPPTLPDTSIDVPRLTQDLEASHRPGHFQGVCRVVLKLLNIIQPDTACFGEKDYQQLKVIEAMVDDLALPVNIAATPTVRERDGLAMSSRNAYLCSEDRAHAVALYKALCEAKALIQEGGENDPAAVEQTMDRVLRAYHVEPDYTAVRHPQTLMPLDCIEPRLTGGVAALVAGRLGRVRLIDNMVIGHPTSITSPMPHLQRASA